jgi:hypothetical protein
VCEPGPHHQPYAWRGDGQHRSERAGTVRRNDPISHGQREIGREHDARLDHAPWSMGQSLHDPYPPFCADVGAMPIKMPTMQIRVICPHPNVFLGCRSRFLRR